MEKRNVPGVSFPKDLSCMQRVSFSFLNSRMDNESATVANLFRKHIIFKLGHFFSPTSTLTNSSVVLLEYPMFRYAGTGMAYCIPLGATRGKNGF